MPGVEPAKRSATGAGATLMRRVPRPGVVLIAILTALLDSYHLLVAPFLAAHCGGGCRFEPSCSRYAKTALQRHGVCRGSHLAIRRVARCNPWGGHGYDPVPQPPALSTSQGVPWTHDS